MKLIDELLKQNNTDSDYRCFVRVDAGKYKMSVQGSTGHYCSPRELISPDLYSTMELALFKGDKWINPRRDKILRAYHRYNELMERCDGISAYTVYGYVPVELLNDLYLYLKEA